MLSRKVQLQPFPSDSSLLLTSAFTASEQNYHVRDGFEKRVPRFIHFVDCYQGSTHPVDNPVSLALFPNHTLCMPLSQTFLPHTLFIEACKTLGRTANVNFISIWVHSHRAKFVRQIISFFLTFGIELSLNTGHLALQAITLDTKPWLLGHLWAIEWEVTG